MDTYVLVFLILYLIVSVVLFFSLFDHPDKHLALPLVLVWPIFVLAGLVFFSLGKGVSKDGGPRR